MINEIRAVAAFRKSTVALSCENSDMTYEEFMQRVDGLALSLRNRNIGAGHRVAVVLPRSFEMIIGICGVLAAGATYIPLDPSNPSSRLISILEDCNPSLILSKEEDTYLKGFPILLSRDWPLQGPAIKPENALLAYIIYTSGSTGKPKGVEVSCAALENYVKWAMRELPFTGGGVPLFTSISFDHAITNIFPPLLMGERIRLLPSILGGRALASALLPEQLKSEKYSYVKITPSLFAFLDKEQRAELGRRTNLLMFGGEKFLAAFIADARRQQPDLVIMNHYGPTEATVGCCVYKVPHGFSDVVVPIGKPIPGVEASIRRADFSKVAIGETGELFISGVALANGYWQKNELTASAFLNLPDAHLHEKRWYRTGDLVLQSADHTIVYLGRADDQIKILGNRIEPAEIIHYLKIFPNVKQAAVFTCGKAASSELVAALSFFGDKPLAEEIRKHLQTFLPPAMVPTRYLLLDEIPIAASGKADIKRLRTTVPDAKTHSSIEQAVLNKFREILCLEEIGTEDDYFLLGGDSLGTVEIATWAAAYYRIPLDISCIFDFPTIAGLSKHIRKLMEVEAKA